MQRYFLLALGCAAAFACAAPAHTYTDWPHVTSAIARDPALEARVAAIVSGMTLEQKIGQMTQAEIKTATPDDVRRYYLGSILNGGGSWPNGNKYASAANWLALADRYYAASMATDMKTRVPVIWGIDAIHGNSNVFGATQFPHNIGLGAAHDPALVQRIGAAVGQAVRATGIAWVFAPTLAVTRDIRWGRSYESFSEDGMLVRSYASAYVQGLQGSFQADGNVVATAKHYMGDGGTAGGKDQGVDKFGPAQMINVHGQGYYGALGAGVQTVMASYSSWSDTVSGIDHGKMHGSRYMLTDVLKAKLGFDGFVVSDWNGIGQVPGCSNASCAQAINAGIDMVMVPDDWKAFITNTVAQVRSGEIPMARIDDAVTRIVRVKLRAGLFGKRPSDNAYAGKQHALQARALAREAVRKSLVLLKNDGNVLPLGRETRVLVVGKSADSLPNQTGGWTLTWQGTDNRNSDFPHGQTILSGIMEVLSRPNVTYSADATGIDLKPYDAIIAVIGETPYAEGAGDIGPARSLRHTSRYAEDLAVLQAVAGKGKPVITVLVAGRPLYINDVLNMSDSLVMAWLPGTEGGGVADVLFRGAEGRIAHDFTGTLPFSWPGSPCTSSIDAVGYTALFARGYGLHYGGKEMIGQRAVDSATSCGATHSYPVFTLDDRTTWPLYVSSGAEKRALGSDLNEIVALPTVKVETAQINTQQDAKLVTWTGSARIEAHGSAAQPLPAFAVQDGALQFDTLVRAAPQGKVRIALSCGAGCQGELNAANLFRRLAPGQRATVKIPLACFIARGADLSKVDTPFSLEADARFSAAFTNIQFVGGAAKDADALRCEDLE